MIVWEFKTGPVNLVCGPVLSTYNRLCGSYNLKNRWLGRYQTGQLHRRRSGIFTQNSHNIKAAVTF